MCGTPRLGKERCSLSWTTARSRCSLVAPARGRSSASRKSFTGALVRPSGAAAGTRACKATRRPVPGGGGARSVPRAGPAHTRAHPEYTGACTRPGPRGPEVAGLEAWSPAARAAREWGGPPGRAGTKDALGRGRPGRAVIGGWGGAGESRSGGDWPRPQRGPSRPPRPSRPKPEPRLAARDPPAPPPSAPGAGRRPESDSRPAPLDRHSAEPDNLCT